MWVYESVICSKFEGLKFDAKVVSDFSNVLCVLKINIAASVFRKARKSVGESFFFVFLRIITVR